MTASKTIVYKPTVRHDLQLCGVLEKAQRFPKRIALEDISRVTIPTHNRQFWEQSLMAAEAAGFDHELITAIQGALARSARAESHIGRAKATTRLWMSRLGVSRRTIKAKNE